MASISRLVLLATALFAMCPAHAAVEISIKPTQNMTCSAGVCTPTARKAVLNIRDLISMLAAGNLTVTGKSLTPDIQVDSTISWSSDSNLTLDAKGTITFNKSVSVKGGGGLTLDTDRALPGGDYTLTGKANIEFWDTKSAFVIDNKQYFLVSSVEQMEHEVHHDGGRRLALSRNLDLSGQIYTQPPIPAYAGTFEGLGHTISNLTISSTVDPAGFFGEFDKLDNNAIRDVGLLSVNVAGQGPEYGLGALVGKNFSTVQNSHVTGKLSGFGMVGGLVGYNLGLITKSYADISVSSAQGFAGGVVGKNEDDCGMGCHGSGMIDESFASGSVSGGDETSVGGLAGENVGGTISNSYAMGAVTGGNKSFAGGLIGENIVNPNGNINPMISASYSLGTATGGSDSAVGGIVGEDLAQSSFADAYWDFDRSGISDPTQGAGNIANDPGITGLSDAQLKSGLPSGFDPSIWKQNAKLNGGYPYLIDNTPPK